MFGLDPKSVIVGIALGVFVIPIVTAKARTLKAKGA